VVDLEVGLQARLLCVLLLLPEHLFLCYLLTCQGTIDLLQSNWLDALANASPLILGQPKRYGLICNIQYQSPWTTVQSASTLSPRGSWLTLDITLDMLNVHSA
jgi:hypothetical protein